MLYAFDTSLDEYWLPLISGGTLVFAEEQLEYDLKSLLTLVRKHEVTILQFVPSLLDVFCDVVSPDTTLSKVRTIISGGSELKPALVTKVFFKI